MFRCKFWLIFDIIFIILHKKHNGVPHGSIIRQLRFPVYVNDASTRSATMQTQLFVDDAIVFKTGSDIDMLISSSNNELIKLNERT